jgi:hypothetical protein
VRSAQKRARQNPQLASVPPALVPAFAEPEPGI